ncbi:CRISPR-associated protein Cas5 family [Geobacter metallireducens RCH3]|uniref:pre-crRNA processing endonuclease n=1 Tax=Geobacter metallireducens (strain ATCC 53774 / DSM 7210 / GS-15) TaxID=269799 RepID=Q39WR9_GEOMG|nr:type I-C CRISPR-associated protein Cas5c [Geobacter metallireducens]ABB31305.1 CRISPR-associated protein CasD [Geobacter metallireducens GS-15]EHP86555.1 CRISPR-associated protein Cas5 family [Geobacter metallireducens RCH3]
MDMASTKSRMLRLKVWGDNACFTRPEMKVERVSYDVMTPSAARGVLEAILWKPAIRWQVDRIDVLKPIRWESVRRNEVGSVMSPRTNGLFIEEQRQQRAGLFLRDVAYTIHAWFEMTVPPDERNNVIKFQEMFICRASKGKCFNQPYLGTREFSAGFELIPHDQSLPEPIVETRDLGFMLYDLCHDTSRDEGHVHTCTDGCRPSFFRAALKDGRMMVPARDSEEVRR